MKKFRMLWKIIKICYADKILLTYLIIVFISAILLTICEPSFSVGDSIWYLFSVISTAGFGDVVATTVIGKVITIIIGVLSMFMIALITGVVVNSFNEFVKLKRNESIVELLDNLEHLDTLSKEELKEISNRVKKNRDVNKKMNNKNKK